MRPVTVFFGANEAGKSTYLQFIRAILFGFPRRRGADFYPPLAGGPHGGSVTMTGGVGDQYVVRRTQGAGDGPVTVTTNTGDQADEGMLARLRGHHSKDVFENVFAFTLDELHSDDLLKDESVNSQIYSVGMGATALPAAMKKLSDERRDLFLKGGSNPQATRAQVGSRLSEVEARLRDVANNAQTFGERQRRLHEVETELQEQRATNRGLQSKLDQQRQLENAWPHWTRFQETRQRLADLPEVSDFPVDGVGRLESFEQGVDASRREYATANDWVERAKAEATAEIEREEILERSATIRDLVRRRTSFDESVRDLPKRQTELSAHRQQLAATLQELGPEWDENRLEAFDLSIAVQEEIARFEAELREAGEGLGRSEADLAQIRRGLAEAEEERVQATDALDRAAEPELDPETVGRYRGLIASVRVKLDQLERFGQSAASQQAQLDGLEGATTIETGRAGGATVVATGVLLIGVILFVLGAVQGGEGLVIGIVAGLALLAAAAYLFVVRGRTASATGETPLAASLREALARTEMQERSLTADLERDAAPLELSGTTIEALSEAERRLGTEEQRIADRERLAENLRTVERRIDQRERHLREAEDAFDNANKRLEDAGERWRGWLRDRNLHETFAPQTAGELRERVNLGRTQLQNVREWQDHRIGGIRQDIDRYIGDVEPLASAFGFALDTGNPSDAAVVADRLSELYERVREQERARSNANERLSEAEEMLAQRRRERDQAENQMKELLEAGGASDAEDFRRRAQVSAEREAHERQQADDLSHLRRSADRMRRSRN